MTTLSQTIARLASARTAPAAAAEAVNRLGDLPAFAPNPGALRARTYIPAGAGPGAPLVVVLHGCTQTAAGYDQGAGWSTLADREGFALLFPEQVRANNPNLCFNWFMPGDIGRTGGEAESIAGMIEAMLATHQLDRRRVFVTGLSAGGAMAAVMLATYPELFAGGAIIGGLPYACASGVPEALARMRGQGGGNDADLATAVRLASGGHDGPWPAVSIWHGTADATVSSSNMDQLGRQWRSIHGVDGTAPATAAGPGWTRQTWRGADGRDLVEEWSVAGMGHGVPLDVGGPDALGASGPYMLDVGLSSTAAIARGWGLLRDGPVEIEESNVLVPALDERPTPGRARPRTAPILAEADVTGGVQRTIENALRSAGLMR